MCRKITGATTSLNLSIPSTTFTLTSGKLKFLRTTHSDDGFEFKLAFCENCGTPIYVELEGTMSGVYVVQAGSLDDTSPLEAVPAEELNIKHRMKWISAIDGAVQKEGY